MSTFAQCHLHPLVLQSLQQCGYTTPTPIQAATIPPIIAGNDIIACAQTGSGKTAAFILPALSRLAEKPAERKTQVLVLAPTRELAEQIKQAADKYGKLLRGIKIVSLIGGMPYGRQRRELPGATMIIATPGRLLDHLESGQVDLSAIQLLVLDEADRMADMGFIDDIKTIARHTPKARQTLLFSATVNPTLARALDTLLKNPQTIDVSPENIAPDAIEQRFYLADNEAHKMQLLENLLQQATINKAIIFCATKLGCAELAQQLADDGYAVAALHGDLKQGARNRIMQQFRRRLPLLIATDVAARGINVGDITHVFNYDMPRMAEDYVHRIGRTARGGKSGIAISFLSPHERRQLRAIEQYLSRPLTLSTIAGLEPETTLQAPASKKGKGKPRRRHQSPAGAAGEARHGARPKRRFAGEGQSHGKKPSGFGSKKRFSEEEGKSAFGFGSKKRFAGGEGKSASGFGSKKRFSEEEGKSASGFGHSKRFAEGERKRFTPSGKSAVNGNSGKPQRKFNDKKHKSRPEKRWEK